VDLNFFNQGKSQSSRQFFLAQGNNDSPEIAEMKKSVDVTPSISFSNVEPCASLYRVQGCQMVCFQAKNPKLDKFLRAIEWKMPVYFVVIWNILRSFGIFNGHLIMLL
jgi:hypothetical protein